ncbi:hypothetical protein [Rhodococcus opacus]|uniref:hypothetical protein n=1 Tax=Rhodococcus opacus TaxID=37919 RepID=UPI0027E16C1A|nr:hypothetical protein [Rhodococcus opacus]
MGFAPPHRRSADRRLAWHHARCPDGELLRPITGPRVRPRCRRGRRPGQRPDLDPHNVMLGNRPSTTILVPQLTPSILGQLIALYEHQDFVQGVIWGVNPFDQWGVELGKTQASALYPLVAGLAGAESGGDHPPTH